MSELAEEMFNGMNNTETDYMDIPGEEDSENRHNAQCRVCSKNCVQNESHKLTSQYPNYFEQGENSISLVNLINKIAHIQLLVNESFPNYICGTCFYDLTVAYSFVQKVIESEAKLKSELKIEDLKIDNNALLQEIGESNENKEKRLGDFHSSQTGIDKKDASCGTNDDFSYFQQHSQLDQTIECNIDTIKEEPIDPDDIKIEKPDYNEGDMDEVDEVDACPKNVNDFQIGQISIEPLSVDAALKIHQNIDKRDKIENSINTQNGTFNDSGSDDDEEDDGIQLTQEELKQYEVEYLDSTERCENNLESLCNAAFIHKNIHTCILCNQKYRSKKGLKYHVEYFHTYCDPIKCEYCDELFTNLGDYSLHKNSHSSNTAASKVNYSCDVCDKSDFISEDDYNNHVYNHNFDIVKDEDAPRIEHLPSDDASLKFKVTSSESSDSAEELNDPKDGLNNDVSTKTLVKVPSEENTIKCLYCPQMFKYEYSRLTHMAQHEMGRCNTCYICNSIFKRKHQLTVHLYKEHGESLTKKKRQKIFSP